MSINSTTFQKGHITSLERRSKISDSLKRYYASHPEHKEWAKENLKTARLLSRNEKWYKTRATMTGDNNPSSSLEVRKKLSGSNSHLWKGGVTPINAKIRSSFEYRNWRKAVFARDDYRCLDCGARSEKGKKVILQADHIYPFSLFPRLRLMLENGRTLCIECHRKTATFARKINKYQTNG